MVRKGDVVKRFAELAVSADVATSEFALSGPPLGKRWDHVH